MIPPTSPQFERRFLSLATTALACTLRAMGGEIIGCDIPNYGLESELQGLQDYCAEMRLLCAEAKRK